MGPNELMKVLDGLSTRLHDCGQESFVDDAETEAWHVACGAVDTLRMIVTERMSRAKR